VELFGVWGRIIDVDLTTSKAVVRNLPPEVYRKFLGGRGLAAWILWKELGERWSSVDPLSPDNILTILTGPLTSFYPGTKLSISGKSPLTNGVVGSTVSSEVAHEIKKAGYDGIIVRGRASEPVYIYVEDDKIEIRDAKMLWGLSGLELLKKIREEVKNDYSRGIDNDPAYIYIGPAGENLVRTASVMAKLSHGAGYGGYGAVMGSKMLKAVVVKGRGPLPKVAKPEKLKELFNLVVDRILKDEARFRVWGTTEGLWHTGHDLSSEPVRNWQEEWHNNPKASVAELQKLWSKVYRSCAYCPVSCMFLTAANFRGKTLVTDGPDYEMAAYLGPNLGVFNAEDIAKLSAYADYLGLCGIQTGNVMGFAVELYERGILTKNDVGYELRWGDVEALARLMEDIAYRRGIGRILAEGTYRAAVAISKMKGVDVLKYAVQAKGHGLGAHGIRSRLDYPQPIAYVASVQGGDHTSVAGIEDGKPSEAWSAFIDSAVICMFTTFYSDAEKVVVEYLDAITGWSSSEDIVYKDIGLRILTLQRVLLLLGGPDVVWDPRVHDDNPPRFYEPLPTGPHKGKTADRDEVAKMKLEYFRMLGWDELGIPTDEALKLYGLEELQPTVHELRRRFKSQ